MDQLLSVIVPVYNVQEYVSYCINSLLRQTYQNLEIILVDDGSTDDSGRICDQFAAEYDRVVVYHKKNGGLSSARNYGLQYASGEIVAFVDSDDWVDAEMYSTLIRDMQENHSDVSACGYRLVYDDVESAEATSAPGQLRVFRGTEVLSNLYTDFCAWNKVYRKELFAEISFPEGKLYEDARTTYKIMALASVATVNSGKFYNYRQRSGSIMKTFSTKNYLDRVHVWDEIYDFIGPRFSKDERLELFHRKNRLCIELLASICKQKQIKNNRGLFVELSRNIKLSDGLLWRLPFREKLFVAYFKFRSFILKLRRNENAPL